MLSPDGFLVIKGRKVIYSNEAINKLLKIGLNDDIMDRMKSMVSDEGIPLLEVMHRQSITRTGAIEWNSKVR